MISVQCSSVKPDKTELTSAEVLCMCVWGGTGVYRSLRKRPRFHPETFVSWGRNSGLYIKRQGRWPRNGAKLASRNGAGIKGLESVCSFHCIPVGHTWQTCHKEDQKAPSCSGLDCDNRLTAGSPALVSPPPVHTLRPEHMLAKAPCLSLAQDPSSCLSTD